MINQKPDEIERAANGDKSIVNERAIFGEKTDGIKRAVSEDKPTSEKRKYTVIELGPKDSKLLPKLSRLYTLETVESAMSKFDKQYGYVPDTIYTINGYICIEVKAGEAN